MAWRASASTPEPEVNGGGGGIMEGETEEAAVPFEPGKGKPPGANLEGACRSKSIRQ